MILVALYVCTSAGLNSSMFFDDRDITRGILCIPTYSISQLRNVCICYLGIYLPSHCYELFHQIMTQTPNHTVSVFHVDL